MQITLSVLATGSSLTYQWQKSSVNIFDSANVSGTGSDTLTITTIDATNAGTYRVKVTSSCGTNTVTSSNAVVTVASPIVITNQPVSQTVVSGSNAIFAVSVTGQRSTLGRVAGTGNR